MIAELLVDGEVIAEQNVRLAGDGKRLVNFRLRAGPPGDHRITVRIGRDRLPVDNQRHLVVNVRSHLPVLCVEDRAGESFNVATALAPDSDDSWPIKTTTVFGRAWTLRDLPQFDCIVFCNVRRFQTSDRTRLNDYIARGGNIIFFLGPEVDLRSYNTVFAPNRNAATPFPAILQSVQPFATYQFDALGYRHPIVAPFRGFEQSGLLSTPVWKYIRMEIPESTEIPSDSVLNFSNGDSALVAFQIGSGRCLVYSGAVTSRDDALGQQWTAIEGWWSFPPPRQ